MDIDDGVSRVHRDAWLIDRYHRHFASRSMAKALFYSIPCFLSDARTDCAHRSHPRQILPRVQDNCGCVLYKLRRYSARDREPTSSEMRGKPKQFRIANNRQRCQSQLSGNYDWAGGLKGLTMQVTVWLNAFIPGTVPGYTQIIPAGPHRGKTAVPTPGASYMNPLNWTVHRDNGFLTDQRTFSAAPTASVRMRSLAVVELSPFSLISQSHMSSGTTQVDRVTGVQRGYAVANMSRCSFALVPASQSLRLIGQAGDPLVHAAADIDYEGYFSFTFSSATRTVTVIFDGKIDAFPAFSPMHCIMASQKFYSIFHRRQAILL